MAKKTKVLPLLEKVEITDIAAEGKAIARVNEMVVFVPWTAPGDIVDIRLTRKKSNYAEGKAVFFHKNSPVRSTPFCEHFGLCGGCKWQHLPYDEQLRYKQKQVYDTLERIGKVDIEEALPIIGSKKTLCYRNKLEYTFSNRRWLSEEEVRVSQAGRIDFTDTADQTRYRPNLGHIDITDTAGPDNPAISASDDMPATRNGAGFHIPKMFDKVLDIKKCWLQDDVSNRIRLFVKNYCLTHDGYPFFDLRKLEGFIRTLIIRTASTGELMVIAVFYYEDTARREALLAQMRNTFPEITSLMYVINGKCNDTITDQNVIMYVGKDHLIERMENLQFKIGPKSFYQTNSEQAYRLYQVVRDFAGLSGDEIVYDLYTGTGTIANFIASQAKKVIGIEYVPEAIEDAKINARLNNLDNTLFFAGDIKDILTESFMNEYGKPDVIITDPPRPGMHDSVIDAILTAEPRCIVYVSCNPATQARDLSRLCVKYVINKVQPVDMFPHTHHVENVARLKLNN